MSGSVIRFSVSADPDLLKEFDEIVDKMGYNRSNAIQMAMRDFLTDHRWRIEPKARIVGAITMIYNHDVGGLGEALIHIQHHHKESITSTTHVHLDEQNCLETIVVKGEVKLIQNLYNELMSTKGVKQIKISILMEK